MPAVMLMLGDANWLLPDWLERLLPRPRIEGGERQQPAANRPAGGLTPAPETAPGS